MVHSSHCSCWRCQMRLKSSPDPESWYQYSVGNSRTPNVTFPPTAGNNSDDLPRTVFRFEERILLQSHWLRLIAPKMARKRAISSQMGRTGRTYSPTSNCHPPPQLLECYAITHPAIPIVFGSSRLETESDKTELVWQTWQDFHWCCSERSRYI